MPGVVEGGGIRADGVGEAAPLAHFKEEAAAHAAPQHLVEQGERVAVGIEPRAGAQREREVALFERALLNADRVCGEAVVGCGARGARLARRRGPVPFRQHGHLVHAHVAGDREHDVLRAVPGVDVVGEVFAGNRADGIKVAGDLPGERLLAVRGGADQLSHALGGLIVRALDFGADHGAFALDFALLEQ